MSKAEVEDNSNLITGRREPSYESIMLGKFVAEFVDRGPPGRTLPYEELEALVGSDHVRGSKAHALASALRRLERERAQAGAPVFLRRNGKGVLYGTDADRVRWGVWQAEGMARKAKRVGRRLALFDTKAVTADEAAAANVVLTQMVVAERATGEAGRKRIAQAVAEAKTPLAANKIAMKLFG